MKPLTRRQSEVLRFIVAHLTLHWRPPTLREIAAHFGFSGPMASVVHLRAIKRKGWILNGSIPGCTLTIDGLDSLLAATPARETKHRLRGSYLDIRTVSR